VQSQLIAWGDSDGTSPLTLEEHSDIKRALDGRAYLEAFVGAVIVILTYAGENKSVLDGITSRCQEIGERRGKPVRVIASPVASPALGRYGGLANTDFWEEVKRRTGSA
jgi:hypothetical protein